MSDQREKVEKIRVSVTITKTHLAALDHLVEEGIFLSRGEVIHESLRKTFREYGIEPFGEKEAEPKA